MAQRASTVEAKLARDKQEKATYQWSEPNRRAREAGAAQSYLKREHNTHEVEVSAWACRHGLRRI
jgi:hypothetical protein